MSETQEQAVDLTGTKFGRLTVLGPEKPGYIHKWLCKCDCGNELLVTKCDLEYGHRTSCGCNKKKNISDITGNRYGKLTVLGHTSDTPVRWLCRCDCGNTVLVQKKNLSTGQQYSCGCVRKTAELHDLTGQRFGKLTVLGPETPGKIGKWICLCDCGETIVCRNAMLKRGRKISCGCTKKRRPQQVPKEALSEALNGRRFGRLTVLEKEPYLGQGDRWICQCDCGKKTVASARDLLSGVRITCGCFRRTLDPEKDLTGKRFGKLTVIRQEVTDHVTTWVCRCDCGREIIALKQSLERNEKLTCGQCEEKHLEDLIGQRFGRLVAIAYAGRTEDGRNSLWKCVCDCGNEKIVRRDKLVRGCVRSCGCIRRGRKVGWSKPKKETELSKTAA